MPADREHADQLIGPFVAVKRRDDAEHERNDGTDDETDEGQLHRNGQGRGDTGGHGRARRAVGAKVAVEQTADVIHVALGSGVVKTLLLHILLDRFRRGALTQGVGAREYSGR